MTFRARILTSMTTLYAFKPRFRQLLYTPARLLVRLGFTANEVTLGTTALCCILGLEWAFFLVPRRMFLIFPAVLLLRMALNAIDGIMAVEFGQRSPMGVYLNELGDVVSDACLYLPFLFLGPWMAVVIVLSVISEMAGTIGVMAGASRRYDGPMGKSDRALVFGALALWLGLGGTLNPAVECWLPCVVAFLVAVTIVNRVRKGLFEHAHPHSQALQK